MGIEEETDRTLFIRHLDARVTEEILFELFLQAGPLIRTKIPKDAEGKQKTYGFAVFKHEVSVPYAIQLLNGSSLFGRIIHVQFRTGSNHSNGTGNSSPTSTPNPHGVRMPPQLTLPVSMQRSFSSPDNLQKHAMVGLRGQQLKQGSPDFPLPSHFVQLLPGDPEAFPGQHNPYMMNMMCQQLDDLSSKQRHSPAGGGGNFRLHDGNPSWPYPSQTFLLHYPDDSVHHQQHRNNYQHQQQNAWGGGNRQGGNRHYDDRGGNRDYQDSSWRRY
ncbi:RNA-binding protein 7 isoform X1 [Nerophis lumbriciformis]|uniref:RNA-binding protein 7 isoform X1 n=1 Tax=Nerophis lumbriciformis TaxID=546530 RepID=UPI002ADFA0F8|nr:RNA-binding protein 7-like isoform X1 [Nerophis lumbriciformis]